MFGEIDHIGVAVEDLDDAIALYRDRLGMTEQHRETVEEFGVEAVLLEIGDAHVELLTPVQPDSGVARFLERNGPGMHHVAYRTDDIDADARAPAPGRSAPDRRGAANRDPREPGGVRAPQVHGRRAHRDRATKGAHMSDQRRMDVGFQGGQVLAVRAKLSEYEALEKALGDDKAKRWHSLKTDDSEILIDLAQVVYIQRESGDQKVGF